MNTHVELVDGLTTCGLAAISPSRGARAVVVPPVAIGEPRLQLDATLDCRPRWRQRRAVARRLLRCATELTYEAGRILRDHRSELPHGAAVADLVHAAHQQLTVEWWAVRDAYELFVCRSAGFEPPTICTPEELQPEEKL